MTVGGTIVCITSKIIMVLTRDLNLYTVDFDVKKGLKNPLFKEGICVEVIYLYQNNKVVDILMILPLGE